MGAVVSLLVWAIGLFIFYWVVRAAVKGGILDADRARTHPVSPRTHRPEQPGA